MKVFIPPFHGRYEFLNGHFWLLTTFREPAKFNFVTCCQFCHSPTKTFILVCAIQRLPQLPQISSPPPPLTPNPIYSPYAHTLQCPALSHQLKISYLLKTKLLSPPTPPPPLDICCSGVADTEEAISFRFICNEFWKSRLQINSKLHLDFAKNTGNINSFYIHCIAQTCLIWLDLFYAEEDAQWWKIWFSTCTNRVFHSLRVLHSVERFQKVSQHSWSHCLFVCVFAQMNEQTNTQTQKCAKKCASIVCKVGANRVWW